MGIEEVLHREFAAGNLRIAFPDNKPAACPFYLIRPATAEPRPFYAPFKEWIMNEVRNGQDGAVG